MDTQEAINLTYELMNKHGVDTAEWRVQLTRGTRTLGVTNWTNRFIGLSKSLVENNPEEIVTETILHEIAHVLAGPRNGHNLVWKATALRIGARPEAKADLAREKIVIKTKWTLECPHCKRTFPRSRREKGFRATNYYCSSCRKVQDRKPLVWFETASYVPSAPEPALV